jgi:hypothetical protein
MKRFAVASVGVVGMWLAMAVPALAVAATTQHSVVTLTATHSGQSSGVNANIYNTAANPPRVKQLVLTFPSKTKFNLGSVKPCTLTNKQIQSGKSCPAKSQIGTGSAKAKVLGQSVTASVKAYASGKTSLVIVVHASSPASYTAAIRGTVSGSKMTIPVPKLSFDGAPITLTQLKLTVPKKGTGTKTLLKAGTCTAGKFTVTSAFTYYNGKPVTVKSSSPCTG